MGTVFSVVALSGGFDANASDHAGFAALVGAGAIVVFPILYGAMGSIGTLVGAWLYNTLACRWEGLNWMCSSQRIPVTISGRAAL